MSPTSTMRDRGDASERGAPGLVLVLLAVLTLAAGWLRFDGLARQLPSSPEPDDHAVVQLVQLEAGVPPAERPSVFGRYPLLLATLGTIAPEVARANADAPLDDQPAPRRSPRCVCAASLPCSRRWRSRSSSSSRVRSSRRGRPSSPRLGSRRA
ncbi:MAG: hypothetical protein IPJ77_05495 [Planctomycetes bacterium]|nr:hypothetical protein [Planctomycetota bacterium]